RRRRSRSTGGARGGRPPGPSCTEHGAFAGPRPTGCSWQVLSVAPGDNDLAEGPGGQTGEGLAEARAWEGRVDDRPDAAGGVGGRDRLEIGARDAGRGAQRHRLADGEDDVERRRGLVEKAEERDGAAEAGGGDRTVEPRAAGDVDGDVGAAASGELQDARRPVVAGEERVGCAQRPGALQLAGAPRGDDDVGAGE